MLRPRIEIALAAVAAALALTLALPATAAHAAGIQALTVPAAASQPALKGAVWTPCATPPAAIPIGPFIVTATRDCPIDGTQLPLILISHGHAGSFMGHRDTAQALAEAGFIVAAISHPGDNAQDTSGDGVDAFIERPADIRRLLDHLLGAWPQAAAIDPHRIGFYGFSRGGYTGLVLAGANPHFNPGIRLCVGRTGAVCDDIRNGNAVPSTHDPRIRAAVIADPLGVFFGDHAFDDVRIPIQLWRSERGGDGVTPDDVARVASGLPVPPEFQTVPGAAHFAFLPPCPPALAASLAEICVDEGGFDRAAFHQRFNAGVVEFFKRTLKAD